MGCDDVMYMGVGVVFLNILIKYIKIEWEVKKKMKHTNNITTMKMGLYMSLQFYFYLHLVCKNHQYKGHQSTVTRTPILKKEEEENDDDDDDKW